MKRKELGDIINYIDSIKLHSSLKDGPPKPAICRLVEEFAINESPKLYLVELLPSVGDVTWFGLYSLAQARRPGRARDLSNMFRVGGLVVDKDSAPANGLLEIVPKIKKSDVVSSDLPRSASQILRTDGKRWQVMSRVDAGKWVERESIDVSSLTEIDAESLQAEEPASLSLVAFAEFLRRALLRWEERSQPDVLASYFASHARQESERLLRHEAASVAEFQDALSKKVGFIIQEPHQAAQYLTAMRFFDLIQTEVIDSPSAIDSNAMPDTWVKIQTPLMNALSFYFRAGNISFHFADDMWGNDQALMEFCLCFLAKTIPQWQRLGGLFTLQYRENALTQAMHLAEVLPKDETNLRLQDLNAGVGDFVLATLYTLPANYTSIRLDVCEANSLCVQILRLRLEAMAQRPIEHTVTSPAPGWDFTEKIESRSPSYEISVRLGNVFRDGVTRTDANCHSVLVGEIRPHISRGTVLGLSNADDEMVADFGWGSKIQGIDNAASRYIEAVNRTDDDSGVSALSVRLPASWAEEPDYAAQRYEFCRRWDTLLVNTSEMSARPRDKRLSRGDIVLLASPRGKLFTTPPDGCRRAFPDSSSGYSLLPLAASPRYSSWIALPELALRKPLNGPVERRGMSLIDMNKKRLEERLNTYFSDMPDRTVKKQHPEMMTDTKLFKAREVRSALRQEADYSPSNITDYTFRPFDVRYAYVKNLRPLFSEPANELFSLAKEGVPFLVASSGTGKTGDGAPAWFGKIPCDYNFFAGQSGHFPIWLGRERLPRGISVDENLPYVANLSNDIREFLRRIGFGDPDTSHDTAMLLWLHALAVLYTPAYQEENAEAVCFGWPRIPIPGYSDDREPKEAKELLIVSAALGKQVVELLSCNENLLKSDSLIGKLVVDGKPARPEDADSIGLALTADWGIKAKGNAVRPRSGRVMPRSYRVAEIEILRKIAQEMGVDDIDLDAVFGGIVGDVYLNDRAYWSGIPEWVWEYKIGGRQVLAKWLSYRDYSIIGRPLTVDEVRFFCEMVERIIKLAILGVKLDVHWQNIR